ncbi:uncharacterized protein LOC107222248 [Neodiprion lecontei]|uniref:Uncharacterized protein LOC107222248 n=1 Tax=Neodiprion lecontei TaxID=441921 RepID=A0A6J0BRT7_NEOLC|nr:uncharacterized protein LOC107222248 [Neodiprion lecontei]
MYVHTYGSKGWRARYEACTPVGIKPSHSERVLPFRFVFPDTSYLLCKFTSLAEREAKIISNKKKTRTMAISMRKILMSLFVVAVILAFIGTADACIRNRDGCQPDGSQGNCCSGYCHKEPGWVAGYCRNR